MATTKEVIEDWLLELEGDLIKEYDKQERRASGRFAKGLRYKATDTSATMFGVPHSFYMERGRGPTKKKGPVPLHEIILQWIKDKGITPQLREGRKLTREQLSRAIAFKIHKDGVKIGKDRKVLENVITAKRIDDLIKRVRFVDIQRVQSDVIDLLKKVA